MLLSALFCSGLSNAQDYSTTENLATGSWSGVVTGTRPNDCCTGGPVPLYDPATDTVHWSWGNYTASKIIGIQTALSGLGNGLTVQGYTWSYELRNMNYDNRQGSTDTMTVSVLTYDGSGNLRRSDTWSHNTRFDWTLFNGAVSYARPGPPTEFGNISINFNSRDTGFWGGYYGPELRNVDLRVNYTLSSPPNACDKNPENKPQCPEYAAALARNAVNTTSPTNYSLTTAVDNSDSAPVAVAATPITTTVSALDTTSSAATTSSSETAPSQSRVGLRALSIAREAQAALSAVTQRTVAQSIQQSQAATTDSALDPIQQNIAMVGARSSNSGDSDAGSMTRPGDPVAAARMPAASFATNTDTAPTGPSVKSRVEPPSELAGGADFNALSRGPDLAAYMMSMRDGNMYEPREIYRGQRTVDNARAERFMNASSEVRHQMMIEQQYNLGK